MFFPTCHRAYHERFHGSRLIGGASEQCHQSLWIPLMFYCQPTQVLQSCHPSWTFHLQCSAPFQSLPVPAHDCLDNQNPSSVAAASLKFPGSSCMPLTVSDHFWLRPLPLNCARPVHTMFGVLFAFIYSPRQFFTLHQPVLRKSMW